MDGTSLVTINGPEFSPPGAEMTHVRLFDLATIRDLWNIIVTILWIPVPYFQGYNRALDTTSGSDARNFSGRLFY